MTARMRVLLVLALAVVLGADVVGYVRLAAGRSTAVGTVTAGQVDLATTDGIVFRSTAPDSRGRLAIVAATDPAGPRAVSAVSCNRVFAAGGIASCVRPDGPLPTFQLVELDSKLTVIREIPLVGVPNRTRVSASGRMLTWTVFVQGDSYNGGMFSTRAGILDTRTIELKDLEDFAVTLDGRPYQSVDLNYWGITFASDDRRFFATMSTHGVRYLVVGDFAAATVRTVATNVECPSLSPDGTRIAFKEAIGGDPARGWRLSVLALATGVRTPLTETRSVDDQAAWLDDRTVAYGVPHDGGSDVWSVPADGHGAPGLLIPDAESPARVSPAHGPSTAA